MNATQIMVLELGSKGYTCAQILIIGALRLMGEENDNLTRAMSALSQGIGNSGQVCGALVGGLCLLSMYTAKGNDFEQAMEKEPLLLETLITWFDEEICEGNANTCDTILGLEEADPPAQGRAMDNKQCGLVVMKVWDKCIQLLQESGIDPTMPRS